MSPTGPFRPPRLTWARRRRGIGQAGLSTSIGTSIRAIKGYEAGEYSPATHTLRQLARALKFPERFFLGDEISELSLGAASIHSRSTLTARQRDAALGSAAVAIAFNGEIERLYALPEPDFPDLAHRSDPEEAAKFVRRKWDLGEQPVESMMQALESKGVRVYSLPADAAEADTFSIWHRDQPFVFLNTGKRGDVLRFDLARELGHLLLHRGAAPAGRNAQQAATDFASAFLMHAAAIRADVQPSHAMDRLPELATEWGVPLGILADRLHRLQLLSDWQHRNIRAEIADQPADHEKSEGAARESPQLLHKVFAALRARGTTRHKMASALHVYPRDLDELVFGLALHPSDAPTPAFEGLRPRLRVVS